nr:MAG TPA: hypothetical protein [Caudoviricetes sp.]
MGKESGLKDYVEVNVRIMKFYEKYPEGRILTEIVKWENEVIVMKATAYRDNSEVPASTGYAYEKEGSSFINKTSALENCETSAVGRALAILGFEIKKSVASKEEVANAQLQQASIKQSSDGFGTVVFESKGPQKQSNDYRITEKQLKRLYTLGNNVGISSEKIKSQVLKEFGVEPKELKKSQYDGVCKRLEAKVKK